MEISRACGDKVGRVSRGAAKPLLAGARRAWMESGENDYSPGQCIGSVSASCAPDIDSDGRDDVLAQISYRRGRPPRRSAGNPKLRPLLEHLGSLFARFRNEASATTDEIGSGAIQPSSGASGGAG